jgi:cytochrome c biogenesis protein CcmG, thiol:disulfide interchange protein DsbE
LCYLTSIIKPLNFGFSDRVYKNSHDVLNLSFMDRNFKLNLSFMDRNFKLVAFGLLAFLLILLLYISFMDKKEEERGHLSSVAEESLKGKVPGEENKKLLEEATKKLSELKLLTLDGKEVKLSDYKGKVVLVNFWASWCPPCKEEMPIFEKVYQKYSDKNFVILAVNMDTSEGAMKEFLEKNRYSFPIVRIKGEAGLNIPGLPTSYLVDKDGSVKKIRLGVYRELEEDLSKLLQ